MGEAYGNGSDWVKRKCKFAFIRFDDQRRHYRTRDDDLTGAQALAKCREHICNMAHDVDPLSRIDLRISAARGLDPAAQDAAGEAIGRATASRRPRRIKHDMTLVDVTCQNGFRVL